jgi:hypothetical protein
VLLLSERAEDAIRDDNCGVMLSGDALESLEVVELECDWVTLQLVCCFSEYLG